MRLRLIVSGTANAFPEQLKAAVTNWESAMVVQEVSTEVVLDLITPYYQVHYREICELPCFRHFRTEVDRLVLNCWDTCGESDIFRVTTRMFKNSERMKSVLTAADKVEAPTLVPEESSKAGGCCRGRHLHHQGLGGGDDN